MEWSDPTFFDASSVPIAIQSVALEVICFLTDKSNSIIFELQQYVTLFFAKLVVRVNLLEKRNARDANSLKLIRQFRLDLRKLLLSAQLCLRVRLLGLVIRLLRFQAENCSEQVVN